MKKAKLLLTLAALITAIASASAEAPKGDGWKALFNGKDLAGFETRNGSANYNVEAGAIVGHTSPGSENTFLVTREQFANFELSFEVKVDDGLNSGVQIRSHGRDWGHNRYYGPQIEIESSPGQSGWVYGEGMDTGWISSEPGSKDSKVNAHSHMNNGKWNKFRIVANGAKVKTFINGKQVADENMTKFNRNFVSGSIGFQVHKIAADKGPFEVRWRNVYIREL